MSEEESVCESCCSCDNDCGGDGGGRSSKDEICGSRSGGEGLTCVVVVHEPGMTEM